MAWEGTLPELGKAGIFEKSDLLVFLHPHTKAELDAKIKKAERKFKPGEAVPLKSAPKADPYVDFADRVNSQVFETLDLTPRLAGASPLLGEPYHPSKMPGLVDHLDASDPSTLEGRAKHVTGNAELDAGTPNHFDPNKRGFSPR